MKGTGKIMEYTVNINNKLPFWLGDKVYIVRKNPQKYGNTKIFRTPCPSCNDTGKIKYVGYDKREYETECALCNGYRSASPHEWGNNIEIADYCVLEYIVNSVALKGSDIKSDYKDIPVMDHVDLNAFCKYGRNLGDVVTANIPDWESPMIDPAVEEIKFSDTYIKTYYFHKKSDAEKLLIRIKEYEKQRLKEFNEKFGTAFEYPY